MPTWVIVMLVLLFVVMDSIIITTVVSSALAPFKELSVHYPLRPFREPNVRREFQSMRMGMAGFGKSLHYTVDREFLHVEPSMIVRWFGVRAASLPRKDLRLTDAKPGFKERGLVEMQLGKLKMWVPPWVGEEVFQEAVENRV